MVHFQQDSLHCHPTSQVHSQPGPGRECVDDRMCSAVTIQSEAGWRSCVVVSRPCRLVTGQVLWFYRWNELPLQWRHNECEGVSNHCHLGCLLNRLFNAHQSKQGSATLAFCERNPPVTCGFLSKRAINAEDVSIWWRHYDNMASVDVASVIFPKS